MGLPESLGLVTLLGILFWFGHPIWTGWGWPSVTVQVREVGQPHLARLHVLLVPVTVEIREADGRVEAHEARVFGGPVAKLSRGVTLTLRRNPHDPAEFADVAGAWRLLGEVGFAALCVVIFIIHVLAEA